MKKGSYGFLFVFHSLHYTTPTVPMNATPKVFFSQKKQKHHSISLTIPIHAILFP